MKNNKWLGYFLLSMAFIILGPLNFLQAASFDSLPYSHYTGITYDSEGTTSISLDLGRRAHCYPGTFYDARAAKVIELEGELNPGKRLKLIEQPETRKPAGWWQMERDTDSSALTGIRYNSFTQQTEVFMIAPEFEYQVSIQSTREYYWHTRYPEFPLKTASWKYINIYSQNLFSNDSLEFFSGIREMSSDSVSAEIFDRGPFYYDTDSRVVHYSDDFISMVEVLYLYTGGAHGNTVYKSFTAQIQENGIKRVQLKEIFLPNSPWQKVLSSLVWKEVFERGGMTPRRGMAEVISADYLQAFTLSEVGLTFYFNPYILGPYAEGPYVVTIPLTVLEGTLNPQGPASRFLPTP